MLVANMAERRIPFELKGDFDLVTAADRASEALIVERLQSHFPAHSILGEEGGQRDGQGEYCWYVDPVDGTTNFAHGFPAYNVTMALEKAGELVAGVVYDPTRNEMFAAEKGGGAYLNGHRITSPGRPGYTKAWSLPDFRAGDGTKTSIFTFITNWQ